MPADLEQPSPPPEASRPFLRGAGAAVLAAYMNLRRLLRALVLVTGSALVVLTVAGLILFPSGTMTSLRWLLSWHPLGGIGFFPRLALTIAVLLKGPWLYQWARRKSLERYEQFESIKLDRIAHEIASTGTFVLKQFKALGISDQGAKDLRTRLLQIECAAADVEGIDWEATKHFPFAYVNEQNGNAATVNATIFRCLTDFSERKAYVLDVLREAVLYQLPQRRALALPGATPDIVQTVTHQDGKRILLRKETRWRKVEEMPDRVELVPPTIDADSSS